MSLLQNRYWLALCIGTLFINCTSTTTATTQENIKDAANYELVKDWPQLPQEYKLSQVTGIGIDTKQNIFLFHRTGRRWTEPFPDSLISSNTIVQLDRHTGKVLNSWGANYFIMPHGLTVDGDNNVWVTDVALHQVFKFTHDGKLLMKWGEAKKPGNDSLHFNMPTDVVVSKDGSFYVSDGYGNSRIVRFSPAGTYLFEWGKKGDKPGEFNTPHGIDVDAHGHVYVADRENNRIQKFDAKGTFLKQWKNNQAIQLYSLSVNRANNHLFAIDYLVVNDTLAKGSDILHFDSTLGQLDRFGRTGSYNTPDCWYHDIAIDDEGSIYVGDIRGNRIQKFRKTYK